jgi:hypothetical protein
MNTRGAIEKSVAASNTWCRAWTIVVSLADAARAWALTEICSCLITPKMLTGMVFPMSRHTPSPMWWRQTPLGLLAMEAMNTP